MNTVFKFFILILLTVSPLYASIVQDVRKFAVDLELNKNLTEYLLSNPKGAFRTELTSLFAALMNFQKALYRREVLMNVYDDPSTMKKDGDVLEAAYIRDQANPFLDGYNLGLLNLKEVYPNMGRSLDTITDLKRSGIYTDVIAKIKAGIIHFRCNNNLVDYVESLKTESRRIIAIQMKNAFMKALMRQGGTPMALSQLQYQYDIVPGELKSLTSFTAFSAPKLIFIHLPYLKFTSRGNVLFR